MPRPPAPIRPDSAASLARLAPAAACLPRRKARGGPGAATGQPRSALQAQARRCAGHAFAAPARGVR